MRTIQLLFIAKQTFIQYAACMKKLSTMQKQRFRFLELQIIWEGSIQRKKIANRFGIAMNHVTKVIAEYERLYPNNLRYDHRSRRYTAGKTFKAKHCEGSAQEFLSILKSQFYGMRNDSLSVDILSHCVAFPEPTQNIKSEVLRALIKNILENKQIEIKYQSLKEESPSQRRISPHSLVNIGYRWHVRAFDYSKKEYRDFVLHRILSAKTTRDNGRPSCEDKDWNDEATLQIAPNPLASDGQKNVIAKEYGMKNLNGQWILTLTTKRCAVPYIAQQLRLDETPSSLSKNPVILKNKTELEPLFFGENQ